MVLDVKTQVGDKNTYDRSSTDFHLFEFHAGTTNRIFLILFILGLILALIFLWKCWKRRRALKREEKRNHRDRRGLAALREPEAIELAPLHRRPLDVERGILCGSGRHSCHLPGCRVCADKK